MTSLSNVDVTGTAISSPDAAKALPVTTYNAADLRQQGITSAPQLLQQIAGNNTDDGVAESWLQGGASFANLRGLGPSKTLVLLNGRRLAVNALDGGAVDLNTIPFAAIERVEILRDGASALYGTDAIGGVINFITKKNLNGGAVNFNYSLPTLSGGGDESTLSATFGKGNFAKEGWNVMGTFSYRRQYPIASTARSFIVPLDPRINAVGIYTYPGQYVQDATGVGYVNAFGNSGCNGPKALVSLGHPPTCYENNTVIGSEMQPKTDQPTFFGRAAYRLSRNNRVSLSYLWTRETTDTTYASTPVIGITVDPGNRFFPGNGITPLPTSSKFDPSKPISLQYAAVPLGPRTNQYVNEYHRAVLDFSGKFLGATHYDTAFSYNQSATALYNLKGFVNATVGPDSFRALVNDGQYDPFLPANAQQLAALRKTEQPRLESQADKTRAYIWDGKLTHELGNWFDAGQSILALGSQFRYETLAARANGYAGIYNGNPQTTSFLSKNRDVESLYGELNVPILNSLTLDAQARYDNYSDVGSTLDPKVSLRYQPIKQLTLRASYSEGFHAPTLYDLYMPPTAGYSEPGLSDPVLCPNGKPTARAVRGRDCDTQFPISTGGNPNLKPEQSKSWTAGFVFSPVKDVTLTADFWAVELSKEIGLVNLPYLFDHYNEYSDLFTRDPQTDAITQVYDTQLNLGNTITNGEDVNLHIQVPTRTGIYSLSMNGTYTNKYTYQPRPNAGYISNLDHYRGGSTNFRWKHNITLGWKKGRASLAVLNHFESGYRDYDNKRNVSPYITWDAYGSYAFADGLQITMGSNNVFNKAPPFTVNPLSELETPGYDPRYASGVGRTVYGRLSYKF